MNINETFPSKYLKSHDLKGQAVPVTIEGVSVEELGEGDEKTTKPVLYFQGKEKGLALNKTNAKMIAESYGDETDDWAGKPLEVYPDKTPFRGEIVDCIRVRVPAPVASEGQGAVGF